MNTKEEKTLDMLSLNEDEASELIQIADSYRKNFANKVKENEIITFLENLDTPTEKDLKKLSEMLKNIDTDLDDTDLSNDLKAIVIRNKKFKQALNDLENEFRKYSSFDIPGVKELDSFLLQIKARYSRLADISEDLKEARKQLKKIKNEKTRMDRDQITNEIELFLKNFINPAQEDIEDFIESLEDQGLIFDKKELLKTLVEKAKNFKDEQDKLSKFDIFCRASENLDSTNLILQYRAIRNIDGLARDHGDFIKWIQENHYDILKNTVEKLRDKSSENNDSAITTEARIAYQLIRPFLVGAKSDELICDKCGEKVQSDWSHCAACGNKIKRDVQNNCPNCSRSIDPDWKICPDCGHSIAKKTCSGCYSELDMLWNICPYCGESAS